MCTAINSISDLPLDIQEKWSQTRTYEENLTSKIIRILAIRIYNDRITKIYYQYSFYNIGIFTYSKNENNGRNDSSFNTNIYVIWK